MADVTETRAGPDQGATSKREVGLVGIFTEGGASKLPRPARIRGRARLGRDESVELTLDDSQVSREHAVIEPASGGVMVEDLGSRNGTYVDGRPLSSARALARIGSVIRCGRTLLTVVADVAPFEKPAPTNAGTFVGGARLAPIRELVSSVGLLPHAVLLLGETGTGKERVAEALHAASLRTGQFIAVNCGAIPQNLVEAELFGHSRGAFSGSDRTRLGLFRAAEGGSLFLDEIGDLPLEAQVKLLRAIELGEIRALGDDQSKNVDVRVIAATNANLEQLVTGKRFRADLFHRIATWKIELPPLRERIEDIPLLAEHFAPGFRFSVEAMEKLVLWGWPGNVRELKNAVETAVVRAESDGARETKLAHLPKEISEGAPRAIAEAHPDVAVRARIETALGLRQGNVAQVARDLGRGRQWLYSELERLGIDPEAYRKR
jgi:DNA-binding NtrC family response regulator